jgi:2-dehydro-3-deoxyphosphogluconate aldolase/(4S)-4-hydroxy-2-oxoglutarate aldolase
VTPGNALDFLSLPNVTCVGGSWLVPADALVQGDWSRIEALAREASQLPR